MNYIRNKVYGNILLFSFFLLFFTEGQSQVKNNGGIFYPQNYIVENDVNSLILPKTSYDTLSYTTFKKNIDDFDVIKGCGSYNADQSNVNIARNEDGGFMCVWEDKRSGYIEIDGQLFDSGDEKKDNVIKVSDQYANWNSEPHIVYNHASGEYIITWASSGYDILLQRISKSGGKIGGNINVPQSAGTNTNNPSAAVDKYGNIMITWYSDYGTIGNTKVYCRLYNKDLIPLTDQQIVSQPPFDNISSFSWDDRIASDSSGNFIVTWSSHYNNSSHIVMQQLNNRGQTVNGNILVTDSTDHSSNIFPTITGTETGYDFLLWTSGDLLKGRIFKIDSGFVTPPFTISDSGSTWFTYGVSSDYNNNFYIAFTSNTPYTQIINADGTFIGKNKPAPVLNQILPARDPHLSSALLGSIYCVYFGYSKNDMDVMLQKFDTGLNPVGVPQKLGSNLCSAYQTKPVVKFNQNGGAIIAWIDRRDGTNNLYAQIFDKNSNPVGTNFLVNDTSKINWTSNPFITSDKKGDFIVFFSGGMYSNQNLIYQRISAEGEKIGSNVKLTDYYYSTVKCVAQTDSDGNILVCWYIANNSYSPCYLQQFNSDMIQLGPKKTIFKGYPSPRKSYLGLSVNKNMKVLIAWAYYNTKYESPAGELKAMIFNKQGSAVSDTIHVFSLPDQRLYTDGVCSLDDQDNPVFEWSDCDIYTPNNNIHILRRYSMPEKVYTYVNTVSNPNVFTKMQLLNFNNKKVFAAWSDFENINSIYLDDNNQSYVPIRLQTIQPFVRSWGVPDDDYGADVYNNKLMFAYEANRDTDRGLDIWANVQQIDKFDFGTDTYSMFDTNAVEKVSAAYPNPVKSGVTLTFQLTRPAEVNISVYNILGQKIATLHNGMTKPGVYNETFDTKDIPSGVYFINYSGIKSFAKKFIVIK